MQCIFITCFVLATALVTGPNNYIGTLVHCWPRHTSGGVGSVLASPTTMMKERCGSSIIIPTWYEYFFYDKRPQKYIITNKNGESDRL